MRKNNNKLTGEITEDACQMRTSVDVLADRAKNRAKWRRMIEPCEFQQNSNGPDDDDDDDEKQKKNL